MKVKTKELQPLVAELDNIIAAAKSARLKETAALLRIARLDLLMRAHKIAPDELELVSFALMRGACSNARSVRAKPAAKTKRTRRKIPQ